MRGEADWGGAISGGDGRHIPGKAPRKVTTTAETVATHAPHVDLHGRWSVGGQGWLVSVAAHAAAPSSTPICDRTWPWHGCADAASNDSRPVRARRRRTMVCRRITTGLGKQ
jgi:hypothetical protein